MEAPTIAMPIPSNTPFTPGTITRCGLLSKF
ncbi:hypothetical protein AZE42_11802 [Rhizopogon vesiculosus]|uniref:Uncharacterized protein n=1 Tax=Rhizopogon vesiculosus TaxID=180088 RepID=A0A1J8R2J7_9AGAM|nr:hypothetical protein AZE42_11802 [Rhizopogon vesiculosus]